MVKPPPDDDDQIRRFGRELKEGTWLENARSRSQRRKSAWNLLLPLFALPLWGGMAFLIDVAAELLHQSLHPNTRSLFGTGPIGALGGLVLFPSILVAICPALVVTNVLVYQIPPARRAMDLEDRGYSGVDYASSQRGLLKAGAWIGVICLPLIAIGASLA